jgi:hypothetical protein
LSPDRSKILFPTSSRPKLGLNLLPNKTIGLPVHETGLSPTSDAEVTNTWSFTLTPPHGFAAKSLIS